MVFRACIAAAFLTAIGCAKAPARPAPAPAEPPISEIDQYDYCEPLSERCYQPRENLMGKGCPDPDPLEVDFVHGRADIADAREHLFAEIARDRGNWRPTVRLRLITQRDPDETSEIDARRIEAVRHELLEHGIEAARIVTNAESPPELPSPRYARSVRIVAQGCPDARP